MTRVLVVDDSALARKLFSRVLSDESGFEVESAKNGLEALERLETFEPDVITLDVHMPGMDGLQCLDRIMLERPCPVVMVSALTNEGADATLKALDLGAVDFIPKPRGAVSLRMDEFAPMLIEKVRAASTARLRSSARLRERVQHRIGKRRRAATTAQLRRRPVTQPRVTDEGAVLVGCSTGGPPALEALLAPLPESFGWPILVAQHMPASFTGPLARRLDQLCRVRVLEVRAPTPLEPGHVYIGRGDADLLVARRSRGLIAMSAPADRGYPWHPSMNRLVRSVLSEMPAEQLVAVIMTGMGNDGVEAVTEMCRRGGRAIAESEETAVVWGMPGELVRAGSADWVEPLPRIAERLIKLGPEHAARS